MGPAEVREHCVVNYAGKWLLRVAMQARPAGSADERAGVWRLQAIAHILKLARTIEILHCVQDRPGGQGVDRGAARGVGVLWSSAQTIHQLGRIVRHVLVTRLPSWALLTQWSISALAGSGR